MGTRQGLAELLARGDVELREHLAQVVLDRTRTDEEPRPDLGVREPVAGELRDLSFLPGQLCRCLRGARADGLTGRGGDRLRLPWFFCLSVRLCLQKSVRPARSAVGLGRGLDPATDRVQNDSRFEGRH